MSYPKLELFKFDSCPFCQLVMSDIESKRVLVQYLDIYENRENMDRLLQDTGRRTVPCLYIDNQPMFESRDIMHWIDQNIDRLEKK